MISGLRRSSGVIERTIASKWLKKSSSISSTLIWPLDAVETGEHADELVERSHLADLTDLLKEVVEVELAILDAPAQLLCGALAKLFLGALAEGGHVAASEDAGGEAVGVELFEGVGSFADAEELDRGAGDGADRERRAAAGVAVHLGEDDAGDADGVVEGGGGVDGVLAGHRVGDEQDFGRLEAVSEVGDLGHHVLVDVEPAGGVDDDGDGADLAGAIEALGDDLARRGVGPAVEDLDVELFAERLELIDCGGAIDVGGDQQGLVAGLLAAQGELGGGGGLAGALEADDEDDGGRLGGALEARGLGAEQGDEFVVDDLDQAVERAWGAEQLGGGGASPDGLDVVARDFVVDIGFEQGEADLAEGGVELLFGDAAAAAEGDEDVLELAAEGVEHRHGERLAGGRWRRQGGAAARTYWRW